MQQRRQLPLLLWGETAENPFPHSPLVVQVAVQKGLPPLSQFQLEGSPVPGADDPAEIALPLEPVEGAGEGALGDVEGRQIVPQQQVGGRAGHQKQAHFKGGAAHQLGVACRLFGGGAVHEHLVPELRHLEGVGIGHIYNLLSYNTIIV